MRVITCNLQSKRKLESLVFLLLLFLRESSTRICGQILKPARSVSVIAVGAEGVVCFGSCEWRLVLYFQRYNWVTYSNIRCWHVF